MSECTEYSGSAPADAAPRPTAGAALQPGVVAEGREGAAVQATLMSALLTKRRAVDLCRVATCLCRFA